MKTFIEKGSFKNGSISVISWGLRTCVKTKGKEKEKEKSET